MMKNSDATNSTTRFLVALALTGLLGACAEPATDSASDTATAEADDGESKPDTYQVRGEIITVPATGDEERTVSIRHEAIDDYKGVGGEVWGMDSMTMPFPVAQGVSLDGIEAGDKVNFTLSVEWFADEPIEITSMEEIDSATELEFRKSRPNNGEAEPPEDHGDDHEGHGDEHEGHGDEHG